MLRIGQKVWIFDENCRVYPRDSEGKTLPGGPLFSAHFRERTIEGETAQSYITDDRAVKIRKSDLSYKHWTGGRRDIFPDPKAVEDAIYIHDNRHKIAERVRKVTDVEMLRKIDQLIPERGDW